MTSHLFGGVWCASSTAYAQRQTVVDSLSVDPLVKYTVDKSFYVVDCLSSVASKSHANIVIAETSKTLAEGRFSLTKCVVNAKELLTEVSVECRAKLKSVN